MAAVPPRVGTVDGTLDIAMQAAWQRDGFLVLENFLTPATCEALMARVAEIVAAFDPTEAVAFSTRTHAHDRSQYFLESGDEVRCFLEEEALDAEGRLRCDPACAVNKIGHALHDREPLFDCVSRDPRLERLSHALGLVQPLLLQSMYIFKQPGIGGEVLCHQDETFLFTDPPSTLGFWFALEEATPENGCLEVLPGRHRGPVKRRYRRRGDRLEMEVLDDSPWPEGERLALPVARGTLILLHGRLPHLSGANRSARSRQAYSLHLIDGRCRYPRDNWLRRSPDMPLRGFR